MVQCTASVPRPPLPLEHQFSCLSHGFQGGTAGHGILPLWLWLTQWASFPRIFQSLALKPAASCASNGPPYNSLQLGPFFPSLCSYSTQTALLLAARGIFSLKLHLNHVNSIFGSFFGFAILFRMKSRIFYTSH